MRSSSLPLRALVLSFAMASLAACAGSASDGETSPFDAGTGTNHDASTTTETGSDDGTASPSGGGGGGGATPGSDAAPATPGSDTGAGGLCPAVPSCTLDEDCQTGCPTAATGDTWCCDTNLCYKAAGVCPAPATGTGDGGTGY